MKTLASILIKKNFGAGLYVVVHIFNPSMQR